MPVNGSPPPVIVEVPTPILKSPLKSKTLWVNVGIAVGAAAAGQWEVFGVAVGNIVLRFLSNSGLSLNP